MNIKKRIDLYCEKGLITQEQVDNILKFEKELSVSKSFTWIASIAIGIASVLVGIGIIALVADNWRYIPDYLKLLVDLIIWGVLIFGLYKHDKDEKPFKKKALLTFALFYVAATIGLIHQIYNLPYDHQKTFLTWSLLCLPFIIPNRFQFFNILWTAAFLIGIKMDSAFRELLEHLSDTVFSECPGIGILLVGAILGVISIAFTKLSDKVYHLTLIPRATSVISYLVMYALIFASLAPEASHAHRCYAVFPLGILFFIFMIFIDARKGNIGFVKFHSISCVIFIFIAYGIYLGFSIISFSAMSIITGAVLLGLAKHFSKKTNNVEDC